MNHEDGGMTMKENEGQRILELLSKGETLRRRREPRWR